MEKDPDGNLRRKSGDPEPGNLRRRAEQRLSKKGAKAVHLMSEAEVRALVHELQVHQIELEMQNEELRRAWADAEDLREKYFGLYEFAPVGYFTLDENGVILAVNLEGAKLLGMERRSLIGRRFQLFLAPDKRTDFVLSRQLFEAGSRQRHELKLLKNDGTPLHGLIEVLSTEDAEGGARQIRVAFMDITERRHAEKALKQRTCELGERIKELNCLYRMSRMLEKEDVSLEEILQKTVDLLPPAYRYPEVTCARITFEGQESKTGGFRESVWRQAADIKVRERKVGTVEVYYLGERPQTDGGPFLKEARSLIDTIAERLGRMAERKQAEDALRESESKYSALVEGAGDGVVVAQDELIKFANPALAEMSGYTVEELMDMPFLELLAPLSRDEVSELYRRTLKGEKSPETYEAVGLCKDGTLKFVEISGKPILYHGRPAGMGIVRDRTERKKLEEELLKIQKLESVGVLAGGIAHDFNNLLLGILGNISLAKVRQRLEAETVELLNRAEKASLQAKHLTTQFLTFAKGGAPIKETISVKKIVEEMALLALRGSNVACQFMIMDDLWPVEADEGQLSQVINNLVINARQAMPQGGAIQIRVQNCAVEAGQHLTLEKGNYIRISVQDQGSGIPQAHLGKIFDPYFTTKQPGQGLGLTIAHSIMEKHGGHIEVESKLKVGTTFHIYLPAVPGAVAGDQKPAPRSPEVVPVRALVTGKILLMDDEELVRDVGGAMLDYLGYEVEFAEHGAEAVAKYKKAKESGTPFAAVILDLTVRGGMGGREAMKGLLEIDPAVKGIVCSGYADDPIMTEFRKHGFRGVIPKPFKIEELKKALEALIG
jgi:two-component system cell cycle sensor histidine kinase/response regulator CckA